MSLRSRGYGVALILIGTAILTFTIGEAIGNAKGYEAAIQECEDRLAVPSGTYNVTPGTGVAIISMCADMPPLMVEKVNILSDCRDCHYRVHEEG